MQRAAVARPMPQRGSHQAMSFTAAARSEAMSILRYFLNNTTPQELHTRIINGLSNRMMLSTDVENLLSVLEVFGVVPSIARAAIADSSPRHCVRCHKSYMESDNGLRSCVIAHADLQLAPPAPRALNTSAPTHVHGHFGCCKAAVELDVTVKSMHFIGRHTTLMENVAYNATNVRTCVEKECNGGIRVQ
ncbi:hypothetical protein BV22DRAFT_152031 [Leucogyrophana mollusca]|uniref:Uncharacterized protein n=1 Tax=Leucogyrophana mollusca TaxID=85980 RepID=A0ACB8BU45_9AGAM|nr:hypothetical protein BV22DRAFT_152031 [Leucogyrophana mollusca]